MGTPVTAWGSEDLRRIVLESTDTVTHLLESLTGERLEAAVISQGRMPAGSANGLGIAADRITTHRVAVLKGCRSGLPYLYAESTFLAECLPDQARAQLAQTRDPIGRILVAHGLKPLREALPMPAADRADVVASAAGPGCETVWARAYRLTLDDVPVFSIREWFLRPVLSALEQQPTASSPARPALS